MVINGELFKPWHKIKWPFCAKRGKFLDLQSADNMQKKFAPSLNHETMVERAKYEVFGNIMHLNMHKMA